MSDWQQTIVYVSPLLPQFIIKTKSLFSPRVGFDLYVNKKNKREHHDLLYGKARKWVYSYTVFRESAKKANFAADNGERDVCGIVEKWVDHSRLGAVLLLLQCPSSPTIEAQVTVMDEACESERNIEVVVPWLAIALSFKTLIYRNKIFSMFLQTILSKEIGIVLSFVIIFGVASSGKGNELILHLSYVFLS